MEQVLRVWGGSFSDYWFAEDAILKVRLVPQALTIVAIVALVLLTLLFGIIGVIAGAFFAVLLYFAGGRIARTRRGRVAELAPREAQDRGIVTLRIPYSVITEANVKGNRLTLSVEGRKLRVKFPEGDSERLRSLLREKLPDRFSVAG